MRNVSSHQQVRQWPVQVSRTCQSIWRQSLGWWVLNYIAITCTTSSTCCTHYPSPLLTAWLRMLILLPHVATTNEENCEGGRNWDGEKLLMAAKNGNLLVAKQILLRNADHAKYAAPATGITPLAAACEAGHDNMVKLLLEHEADPYSYTPEVRQWWSCSVSCNYSPPALALPGIFCTTQLYNDIPRGQHDGFSTVL